MAFPAMLLIIWVFSAVLSPAVYAADLTPYHVVSSNGRSVTLDLDKNIPAPEIVTVFGSEGWNTATLEKTVQKCEYLCGEGEEDGKECHNEGIYRLNKKQSHGTLRGSLMAVKGKARIEESPDQILFKKSSLNDEKFLSREFSRGYRWARDDDNGETFLFSEFIGPKGVGSKDWYAPPISWDSCTAKTYKYFDILACSGVTLLYHQNKLIELSMAEYSSGKLDIQFSVQINGKTYYAVEFSVKGHGQRLQLMTREDKKWIGLFRKPTYAALC